MSSEWNQLIAGGVGLAEERMSYSAGWILVSSNRGRNVPNWTAPLDKA